MKYGEFVFKYKKLIGDEKKKEDLEKLLDSIVRTYYVPYAKKVDTAKSIIQTTCYDDNHKFTTDNTMIYFLFGISVVQLYTTLEDPENDNEKMFDALDEVGALDAIIATVGVDAGRLQTIVEMVRDDTEESERDLVGYIDFKINEITSAVGEVLQGALEELGKEDNNGELQRSANESSLQEVLQRSLDSDRPDGQIDGETGGESVS